MRKFVKVLMTFVMVGAMSLCSYAADTSDLEEEREEVEEKKEEVQSIVDQLTAQQNNILDTIEELDAMVTDYNLQIVDLETRKAEIEADMLVTQDELLVAQALEEEQYEAMKIRIQYSYENGDADYIDTFFTMTDVTDIVNDAEYTEQVYNYDLNMLEDLIAIKTTVANKQLELETDLEAIEEIEEEVTANKEAIEILIEGREKQVESYALSIQEQEELIAEYEADLADIDAKIDAAIAAYEAQMQAQNGTSTPITWTGGSFQWPVAGNYFWISSYFGPRDLAGTSFHHGLDIPCPEGTPILAGEDGVVILSTYNSSLGYYVCIDHGGGVTTTYGHNSVLAVSAGQTVSRGDVIAYAGNTGFSFGAHCHFAVRINGSYVDPYPYLY